MLEDIIHNILSRLPAKDLFRLTAVCKLWKRVIDDPFFVKSHTINQQSYASTILIRKRNGGGLFCLSLDVGTQQQISIIPMKQLIHRGVPRLTTLPAASCNGLILLSHLNINKSWSIWNPLVQDFHEVPPPPHVTDPLIKYVYLASCGFGYDEASDDYKVVRVDRMCGDKVNEYYRTLIYSLKLRCWRAIEGFPGGDCWGDRGVFLNGSLHWRSPNGTIALHLGREVHTLVAPPPSNGLCWQSLDVLDGCLIWSYGHENLRGIDAWVMKEYGTEKTWTKLFSVESDLRGPKLVAYVKSKGHVFLGHWGSGLHWLDIEEKSLKKFTIFFGGVQLNSLSFAQFYPGSLLRLDNNKSRRAGGVKRKRKRSEGACARFQRGVSYS